MKKLISILAAIVTFQAAAALPPLLRTAASTNSWGGKVGWTHRLGVYVDVTNGVDSSTRGTYELPFKRISYAASNTAPGGVIFIRPGLYVETIDRSWGQKDYIFSKGAIVVGKTNISAAFDCAYNSSSVGPFSSVAVSNNYPIRILGRGTFVTGSSSTATFVTDNGAMEVEADLIENTNAAGFAIEMQGDDADGDDAVCSVKIINARIVGRIHPYPFDWQRTGGQLYLQNVSIVTTNIEPISFDDFSTDDDVKNFKLIFNGVESRCPQTNDLSSWGFGSRIFGTMKTNTWLTR